ncbi:RNA polymerase sigma factor [Clostridium manihotivorum]|uniref:RNA polymerase sigma factor n=1 Tax=Clostridium manihotivorum TaxID=2320868 RepID=A0A3R5QUB8_9CLOT|nr:RNA polymerase sigma factor [Clostridium manihotivorum]QAA32559.1 hypothetical protein C1I91_13455 [Clostridium manihotivorum]
MQEDIDLIQSFKAGNDESFELLIKKYRANAIAFAFKYTRDFFIAEDIAQDSFAYIYVNIDNYKENYSFKTYLFTIIKNKSIDLLRKKVPLPLNEDINSLSSFNVEEEIISRETTNLVKGKINLLKEDYQRILYLIEYEGFSYEEAAKIMDKNLGQIKILIYRARKKLKLLLEGEV